MLKDVHAFIVYKNADEVEMECQRPQKIYQKSWKFPIKRWVPKCTRGC